jgi:hypothetical protein
VELRLRTDAASRGRNDRSTSDTRAKSRGRSREAGSDIGYGFLGSRDRSGIRSIIRSQSRSDSGGRGGSLALNGREGRGFDPFRVGHLGG